MNETSDNVNEEKVADKLLEQLHEQYAINNNANLSSVVALVVAMIGVVGVFGYVYVRSVLNFSDKFDIMYTQNSGLYTMDAVLLSFMASYIILTIIEHLCMYQGYNQRYEQFIINAIRDFYIDGNTRDAIFPPSYHPFDKSNKNVSQGLFGEICNIIRPIKIALIIVVIGKIAASLFACGGSITGIILIVVAIFTFFICNSSISRKENKLYSKYIKRCNEFLQKKSERNLDNIKWYIINSHKRFLRWIINKFYPYSKIELHEVTFNIEDEQNATLIGVDDVLYNNNVVVDIPSQIKIDGKSYTVSKISNGTFKDCRNIKINLPQTINEINDEFEGCDETTVIVATDKQEKIIKKKNNKIRINKYK